jgi:hypothetical protein
MAWKCRRAQISHSVFLQYLGIFASFQCTHRQADELSLIRIGPSSSSLDVSASAETTLIRQGASALAFDISKES